MLQHTHNHQKILLGITGGIAAYKSAELVRLLTQHNFSVQVVMTEAASQFITARTMQALSGQPVYTEMWDNSIPNGMPHIELSREAQAVLVAPASADFIAKLANGFANDLLSTLCLARDCPLLVAPAMNKQMWEHPATQRNIAQLIKDGVTILGPAAGVQACGEVGLGRMLEPEQLLEAVVAQCTPKLLAGKKVMITAGATLEMIDPVRGITNLSSGKMGYAMARVAAHMGAAVTLVHGHSSLQLPTNVHCIAATDAESMYQSVMQHVGHQDIFIAVAAVADYSPTQTAPQKIKKNDALMTLHLKKNKDILAEVASLPNPPFCVGFAAETEHVIAYAEQKRIAKKLPLIVANQVGQAMGQDNNQVTLIDHTGTHPLPTLPKLKVAEHILRHVANMI